MTVLLVFAVVLLVAVLLSDLAERSVLSTAVLFLIAGFALGPAVGGVLPSAGADEELVQRLAEFALFSVLLTDGMRSGVRQLTTAWRLPGRALLLGMPLVFALTVLAGWTIAGLGLAEAALLGAVLAPTDPVFASAIVGREEVPARLRHLLNVESGVNDGLALPVVLVLLSMLGGGHASAGALASELALGVVIGVAVPWIAVRLESSRWLAAEAGHRVLLLVAVGLLVFALAEVLHANLFLAAFAAGVTLATVGPQLSAAFHDVGELAAELLKLAALLVFGASISPQFLAEIPVTGWLFALVTLLLVRPVALQVALVRSELDRPERIVAGWFGPKGFASVVYGLLVVESGIAAADELFHLAALVIVASMLAHSSTDVAVARWFARAEAAAEPEMDPAQRRARQQADAHAAAAESGP
ncbi:cation:proton antiporter [soil metagenome]|jgi:NhaP-type Na+/H+ or K+/H+ antiporter